MRGPMVPTGGAPGAGAGAGRRRAGGGAAARRRRAGQAARLALAAGGAWGMFALAGRLPQVGTDLDLSGLERELRVGALREQGGGEGGCLDRLQTRWPDRFQGCGGVPSACTERATLYGALGDWQDRELELRSRGFSVTELFQESEGGGFTLRPTPLEMPVRVALLLMDAGPGKSEEAMGRVVEAVRGAVAGEKGMAQEDLWWQDDSSYHSTLFHASTYDSPVKSVASGRAQVQAEFGVVQDLARTACPVDAALERLVLTKSGAVVAGWQVVVGAEPADMRSYLQGHLPLAPAGQKVRNRYILHTTIARLLRPPEHPQSLAAAIGGAGSSLCGLEVRFGRLALAEELDLLALGLGGRFKLHTAPLSASCAP